MSEQLRRRLELGELDYVDYYFSRFIVDKERGHVDPALQQLIAELSHALSEQHSCIDLSSRPDADELIAALRALDCVGDGERLTPLVLEGQKLFLHRYHQYERRIAADLAARNVALDVHAQDLGSAIGDTFPGTGDNDINWQQIAALQALTRRLTVITGGPGTGKTSTVVRIIAMALEQDNLNVRLTAPTGKAAMRLAESLNNTIPHLPASIRQRMPTEVQTIHRLLGIRADGRSARYHAKHPLPLDLLVVDEVSMVDLALMARLLGALPEHARLILLGDPDQLPSVEAGNVLADICKYPGGFSETFSTLARDTLDIDLPAQDNGHLLEDAVSALRKSYRFSADRGIGRLAAQIHAGDLQLNDDAGDVRLFDTALLAKDHGGALAPAFRTYLEALRQVDCRPATLVNLFEQSRILSPVREGPLGVVAVNESIEAFLRARGDIDATHNFYHGRPIIITRNDYNLGLFNGDTGVTIRDASDDQLKVAFKGIDGELRFYLASRLPPHESCFAMTIHKSQGSEYDHVVLLLPATLPENTEGFLTRELLYTAVTRARQSVTIYADEATLARGLAARMQRQSGLGERFLGSR